jgi:ElaB/YqjD/DUF883 family membrane-anchored ribosome-binding protein
MTTAEQTVSKIERDAAETRAKLGERLDDLQGRLAPAKNVERAFDYVRDHGGEAASNLAATVRNNPLPVFMIGAGLAWLMLSKTGKQDDEVATTADGAGAEDGAMGRTTVPRYGSGASGAHADDDEGRFGETAAAAAAGVGSKAKRLGSKVSSHASSARDGVKEKLGDVRARAQQAKESSGRFIAAHPLAVGAAGLAAGALIAAALPVTRRESQLVGRESTAVKRAARDAVSEKGREIRAAASAVLESAKQEAKEQGLSPKASKTAKPEGSSTADGQTGKAAGSKEAQAKRPGGKKSA